MSEIFGIQLAYLALWAIAGFMTGLLSYVVVRWAMRRYWLRKLSYLKGVVDVNWNWGQMIIYSVTNPPTETPFDWPPRTFWYRLSDSEEPGVAHNGS